MTYTTSQITSDNDDASRYLITNTYVKTYVSVAAGYATTTNYKIGSGMRFNNVAIPQGVKIHSARLILTSVASSQGNAGFNGSMSAENVDNAAALPDTGAEFDTRYASKTTATRSWSIWYPVNSSTLFISPDIREIVQEVVDRSGWASGNSMLIFYEDFAGASTPATDWATRYWQGYGTSSTLCPILAVTYSYSPTAVDSCYYECSFEFDPSSSGWQDYDLYTNAGIPKGAVAHILMCNRNEASARTMGVRTDGSSLSRYIKIHEAETSGVVFSSMYVKVDSSTGYIETYCDATTNARFVVTGYWTGIDYTEMFSTYTPATASAWTNYDAYTNQNIPMGRVADVIIANYAEAAATTVGVRTDGSSLARSFTIHEAESSSTEYTDSSSYEMPVKVSASTGYIEYYTSSTTYGRLHFIGYFGSQMDYAESMTNCARTTTGWLDWDITSYLDRDGRVADTLIGTTSASGYVYIYGARLNGSNLLRAWEIHESESNGNNGYTMPTGTDANGIMETYCSNASYETIYMIGYYKPTVTTAVPRNMCVLIG